MDKQGQVKPTPWLVMNIKKDWSKIVYEHYGLFFKNMNSMKLHWVIMKSTMNRSTIYSCKGKKIEYLSNLNKAWR